MIQLFKTSSLAWGLLSRSLHPFMGEAPGLRAAQTRLLRFRYLKAARAFYTQLRVHTRLKLFSPTARKTTRGET